MANKPMKEIISNIKTESDSEIDLLVKSIEDRSYEQPREVVSILHGRNKDDAMKAYAILQGIGELALRPMLHALNPKEKDDYVWHLQQIVTVQYENLLRIVKALKPLLSDKRELSKPLLLGPVEEKPKMRRVCDEGYLMLRRILELKETDERQLEKETRFLGMDYGKRDAEIAEFRKTNRLLALIEKWVDFDK